MDGVKTAFTNKEIDVCVVSRDGIIPKGLENIPYKNLIIETSSPIGPARQKCIIKVTTPIFAFIDDDIEIPSYWYESLLCFIRTYEAGAVWGTIKYKGLGLLDRGNTDVIPFGELGKDERFNTNNCLIRTELVKDWKPTIGINCYEDLDIGRHIMEKGYKIFKVPTNTIHRKGFSGYIKSARWAGSRWTEAYGRKGLLREATRRLLAPIWALFVHGIFSAIVIGMRNTGFLFGLVDNEFKRFKNMIVQRYK